MGVRRGIREGFVFSGIRGELYREEVSMGCLGFV